MDSFWFSPSVQIHACLGKYKTLNCPLEIIKQPHKTTPHCPRRHVGPQFVKCTCIECTIAEFIGSVRIDLHLSGGCNFIVRCVAFYRHYQLQGVICILNGTIDVFLSHLYVNCQENYIFPLAARCTASDAI